MPGSTASRYSWTGTPKRRQDSTTERMAATLGLGAAHMQPVLAAQCDGTHGVLGEVVGQLHRINPRLLYCSITGFGRHCEGGSGKAMDAIIQALSGAMMTSGADGNPPVWVGVPFAACARRCLVSSACLPRCTKLNARGSANMWTCLLGEETRPQPSITI
jgi:hypothetical protein